MCNNRVGVVGALKELKAHRKYEVKNFMIKLKINSKGQIMKEGVHHLGIGQRLWLNKVISKHQDWLDTIGYGDEGIIRIHQILRNDMYVEYDKKFLNTLREMYLEFFVYGVKH